MHFLKIISLASRSIVLEGMNCREPSLAIRLVQQIMREAAMVRRPSGGTVDSSTCPHDDGRYPGHDRDAVKALRTPPVCSVTMPPVQRSNWTSTNFARSNCNFSSSGDGNLLTELGRYAYAEAFPEIMPPRRGRMRLK